MLDAGVPGKRVPLAQKIEIYGAREAAQRCASSRTALPNRP
jgi:hypothetical protein